MDFGEPDAHHLFTLTQSDERLQMKFSALVEHVSKKPIPPHVNYLIVEVMVSDEDDEDEDDTNGAPLDWEILGRHACVPYNVRPPVPSFLLGPLSVQKKQRTQTQRRARQTRDAGREARPENLSSNDLNLSNENDLKAVCGRLHDDLLKHCERADAALSRAGITDLEQLSSEKGRSVLRKNRITTTGGPNLLEYALDPQDFGQTVENLFRISFLIKEGKFGVQNDDDGLPTLCKLIDALNLCQLVLTILFRCDGASDVGRTTQE